MKQTLYMSVTCAALVLSAHNSARAQIAAPDWSAVDQVMSRKGQVQPDGVVRYGFPRSDLHVSIGDVQIKPSLALGSWIAMKKLGTSAMLMGDLVLAEKEIEPVLSELHRGGVMATALHNHLLNETPHVMYMHVSAHGNPVQLARAVRSALSKTSTPMEQPAPAAASAIDLDTAAIARELGYHGRVNGGVLQVSVPRHERIMESGHEVPPTMGTATAINFQPLGSGRAAVTGDFVMTAAEVDAVTRALEQNGIMITALHSHMTGEIPRLFFMHFWGNADAMSLARGLHAAIGKTNSIKPKS